MNVDFVSGGQVNPDISQRPVRPMRAVEPVENEGVEAPEESVVPRLAEGPRRPSLAFREANEPMPVIASPQEEVVVKAPKKGVVGGSGKKFRLTDRDLKMLTFLGRYRFATVAQLARAFGTSETALRNRLPRLEAQGLVSWAWVTQNKPKVWLVTTEGLATAGVDLREPTIKWGQFRHNLGLVDLGIEFELAGEIVVTEREIRAGAGRFDPTPRLKKALDMTRAQVGMGEVPTDGLSSDQEADRLRRGFIIPVPGRPLGHVPDMVLLRQPYADGRSGHIAVELELTRKGLGEWRQVLTAYRNSDLYDKVHYFAGSKEIARSMTGVIHGIGAEDKITVSVFNAVDLTGDPTTTGSRRSE